LHLTLRLQELGRIDFFSRPIVLVLIVLTLGNFLLPMLISKIRGHKKRHADQAGSSK
jgi:hypothetical protein